MVGCDSLYAMCGAYKIIVAQRKRVGLITRRTVDRNHPMIIRKMDTVKSVTDMCEGTDGAYIKRVIVV